MAKVSDYEARAEELLTPICEDLGLSVYDVEYVKEGSDYYLRCYIDKEGGVTVNDCEAVSRQMSDRLDEADFIEDAYIFEVSSPGLGRTLKKDRHLAASLGQEVEIKTYKPMEPEKSKEFEGILKSFDKETIVISVGDSDRTFKRNEIALIRLKLVL